MFAATAFGPCATFVHDAGQTLVVAANGVRVTYTRGLDLGGGLDTAGGIGGLLARTDGAGSVYYHADGAGNITALMDREGGIAARYGYGPFGRLLYQSGPLAGANRPRFSSQPPLARAEDIYQFFWRPLFSGLPRWGGRDPLGEAGGVNLYGVLGNNPLSYIDPYGEDLRLASASGPLEISGPLGYARGASVLENVAAMDEAVAGGLASLTGDPQLGEALHRALAVLPLGWPEGLAGAGKLGKGLTGCAPAAGKAATRAAKTAETVAADAAAAGSRWPSFIAAADGSVFAVPRGATGPLPTRAPGMQFTGGSGGYGPDPRVTGVRFVDTNANQGARAVYMNQAGQTVNPFTDRTVPYSDPTAHFYVNPNP